MAKKMLVVVILGAMCACAGAQVRTKDAKASAEPPPDPQEWLISWDG